MTKKVAIKLVSGVEGMERFPELLAEVGRWVTRYEPENAKKGEKWIWTTDDPAEALLLDTKEAFDLITQSIGTRPWDGKQDRPISAYTVEISEPK